MKRTILHSLAAGVMAGAMILSGITVNEPISMAASKKAKTQTAVEKALTRVKSGKTTYYIKKTNLISVKGKKKIFRYGMGASAVCSGGRIYAKYVSSSTGVLVQSAKYNGSDKKTEFTDATGNEGAFYVKNNQLRVAVVNKKDELSLYTKDENGAWQSKKADLGGKRADYILYDKGKLYAFAGTTVYQVNETGESTVILELSEFGISTIWDFGRFEKNGAYWILEDYGDEENIDYVLKKGTVYVRYSGDGGETLYRTYTLA